jgi:hypothetical protein
MCQRSQMDRFPRNFRDNLRVNPRGLLIAAAIIGMLFFFLVIVYTTFDLGAVLPKRQP